MVRCTAYCRMDGVIAHGDTAAKGVVDAKKARVWIDCGRAIVGRGSIKTFLSEKGERLAPLEVVENIAIRVPKGLKW